MTDSSLPTDDAFEDYLSQPVPDDLEDLGGTDVPFSSDQGSASEGQSEPEPEQPFEESTIPVGDGECRVCGAPTFRPPGLTPTGRKKRAPRYCDLHDPRRRVSEAGSFNVKMDGGAQLQRVQTELADELRLLGTMAGALYPVTGYYIFDRADPFTIALLRLFKNNQQFLRLAYRFAQVAPVYEVLHDVAGTAYAVQVDIKKVDPHSTVGQRLGVARAYDAVYPNEAPPPSSNGFTGAPRYATVQ